MNGPDLISAAAAVPGLPRAEDGAPLFAEPWHATAFALTVHLHAKGLFSWSEWADALSRQVSMPNRSTDGADYYECWVEALSGLLAEKGVTDDTVIRQLQGSWQRAAEATPHGAPILLANDPERR